MGNLNIAVKPCNINLQGIIVTLSALLPLPSICSFLPPNPVHFWHGKASELLSGKWK